MRFLFYITFDVLQIQISTFAFSIFIVLIFFPLFFCRFSNIRTQNGIQCIAYIISLRLRNFRLSVYSKVQCHILSNYNWNEFLLMIRHRIEEPMPSLYVYFNIFHNKKKMELELENSNAHFIYELYTNKHCIPEMFKNRI